MYYIFVYRQFASSPNPVLVTGSNAIQFYKNNSATFAGNELPSPANYIQLAGLYFTD